MDSNVPNQASNDTSDTSEQLTTLFAFDEAVTHLTFDSTFGCLEAPLVDTSNLDYSDLCSWYLDQADREFTNLNSPGTAPRQRHGERSTASTELKPDFSPMGRKDHKNEVLR